MLFLLISILDIWNAVEGDSADKQKGKLYLEECMGKKQAFLSSFLEGIQEPISKDTLGGILKKDFFSSSTLRMAIGGRELQKPVK